MKSLKSFLPVIIFSIACFSSGIAQNKITKELSVKTTQLSSLKSDIKKIESEKYYNNNDEINKSIYLKRSKNENVSMNVEYSTMKSEELNIKNSEKKEITKLKLVKQQSKSLVKLKYKKET